MECPSQVSSLEATSLRTDPLCPLRTGPPWTLLTKLKKLFLKADFGTNLGRIAFMARTANVWDASVRAVDFILPKINPVMNARAVDTNLLLILWNAPSIGMTYGPGGLDRLERKSLRVSHPVKLLQLPRVVPIMFKILLRLGSD